MLNFGDMSIRRKLKLISMLALTVALLLASSIFVAYDYVTFRQAMVRDLTTLARMIERNSTAAVTFGHAADAQEILSSLKARSSVVAASIQSASAGELARYERDAGEVQPAGRALHQEGHLFTSDRLEVLHPILDGDDRIGTVWLHSDLTELSARIERYAFIVAVVLLAALLVAFTLSAALLRTVSAPILHLVETAQRVSGEKNYSVRAAPQGRDELGKLVEVFNEMLSQIQQSDAALQRAHDGLERRVEERTGDLRREVAERQQAEKAIEQQFNRLSLLNHITRAVSERKDLQSILHETLRQLEQRLPTDFGAVMLLDRETGTLKSAAMRCRTGTRAATRELPPRSVAELAQSPLRACVQGQSLYISDAAREADPLTQHLARMNLHSAVAVPLQVEDKLFGLLIAARRRADAFGSGEGEFLRMLSEQVSLAAHHARLYSELHAAYEELRQTQQAVMQHERLRALGQMASGVAHDINNTLSPVVGYTDLILRNEPNLSDTARRHLNHIRTAGEDIAEIVARLREFYRRRDDHQDLRLINLNHLVMQVVELTRPRWRDISQERGVAITVQTELEDSLPPTRGIESEVREALINLILNAVDASPQGGIITLHTRSESWLPDTLGSPAPSRVIIEVIDTGHGMDEETRRRCLEPFFSTKGTRGTGLGLAMVYGIMERHDGSIEIDSRPGKGTRMRLVFPVRQPSLDVAPARMEPEIPLPPLHILFVDDEPLLRELVKETLETVGHHVDVADCGQRGLEAFLLKFEGDAPYDVVITDLGMPHMDGRELSRAIRAASPDTPIIMLTGWGTMMKTDSDLPALVDAVLSKPPKLADLLGALRRTVFPPQSAQSHETKAVS
jgi:signal transduction histidine kinase/ActR/RegA family two-component response regulator/HAMP domain-containing protein